MDFYTCQPAFCFHDALCNLRPYGGNLFFFSSLCRLITVWKRRPHSTKKKKKNHEIWVRVASFPSLSAGVEGSEVRVGGCLAGCTRATHHHHHHRCHHHHTRIEMWWCFAAIFLLLAHCHSICQSAAAAAANSYFIFLYWNKVKKNT